MDWLHLERRCPSKESTPALAFGGWVCARVIWGNVAGAASDVRLQADHIRLGGAGLFCSPPSKPAVAATLPAVMPGSARALAMVTRWPQRQAAEALSSGSISDFAENGFVR